MIGIMQGRLTPPSKKGIIQEFPERWRKEFYYAKVIGLDYIEWIFDKITNPIMAREDIKKIKKKSHDSGVQIYSVCADYFIEKDLIYGDILADRSSYDITIAKDLERELIWRSFIYNAKKLGVKLIMFPLLDKSYSYYRDIQFNTILKQFVCQYPDMEIGLESEMDWRDNWNMLRNLKSTKIGITYDIGNCEYLGMDTIEELTNLLELGLLKHIHIKEKDIKGVSVPLGSGAIGFGKWEKIFCLLKEYQYTGNMTLQLAREETGKEKETVKKQLEIVKKFYRQKKHKS